MLRESDASYPVDIDVSYGATRLTIQGTLEDPFQYKAPTFSFRSQVRIRRTSTRCLGSLDRQRRRIG
jgi:hypothetical protein